jgi:hypothetical protein
MTVVAQPSSIHNTHRIQVVVMPLAGTPVPDKYLTVH